MSQLPEPTTPGSDPESRVISAVFEHGGVRAASAVTGASECSILAVLRRRGVTNYPRPRCRLAT